MGISKLPKIGEILINKQFCTPAQIRHALDIQQEFQTKTLGTILVELTYITKDQLKEALEEQRKNFPFR
jgi:hypothetical protein